MRASAAGHNGPSGQVPDAATKSSGVSPVERVVPHQPGRPAAGRGLGHIGTAGCTRPPTAGSAWS